MQEPFEEVRLDVQEEIHPKVKVVVVPPEHPIDDSLDYLAESRKRMLSIQRDLTAVIGAMDHPSYITQFAEYWGEMPEWKKIVGGFGLSFGLLTLGLITHIGLLITLSAFSAVSYFGGGFFLDDHYASTQRSKNSLQQGIAALTRLLGTVMESMEKAVHELGQQNEKFSTNNEKLQAQVSDLTGVKDELANTLELTKQQFQEQLLAGKQQLLDAERNYKEAVEKIETAMKLQIGGLTEIRDTLASQVVAMAKFVVQDEHQRKDFLTRLDQFLQDGNRSLSEVSERISRDALELASIKGELKLVKTELDTVNTRYKELLQESRSQLEEQRRQIASLGLLLQQQQERALQAPRPISHSRSTSAFFPDWERVLNCQQQLLRAAESQHTNTTALEFQLVSPVI